MAFSCSVSLYVNHIHSPHCASYVTMIFRPKSPNRAHLALCFFAFFVVSSLRRRCLRNLSHISSVIFTPPVGLIYIYICTTLRELLRVPSRVHAICRPRNQSVCWFYQVVVAVVFFLFQMAYNIKTFHKIRMTKLISVASRLAIIENIDTFMKIRID